MSALEAAIGVGWLAFSAYWLIAALGAKPGSRGARRWPAGLRIIVLVFIVTRVVGSAKLRVEEPVLQVLGVVLFGCGLALAVWARVYLGRNWGMPMSQKDEPELVTSGPYRFVRHPIYTGILLALLGTALATNLYWLGACVLVGAYFVHSARVEERILADAFPATYPRYRARTKMLIPFVL
jgi:protein-S-isoprenylcysteine O-methyltransferase Ste14